MAAVMLSLLDSLFVGEEAYEAIRDNLDLGRWYRWPEGHERRIHGHRHAGIRLVREGATLVLALDAHATHPGPFTVDDLCDAGTWVAPGAGTWVTPGSSTPTASYRAAARTADRQRTRWVQ